jgi:3-phosphoshikimate 1-carboxyvinyltransferase
MDFLVRPAKAPLRGVVRVPSDKSIGHRAVIVAALAEGTSTLRRFSFGEDNVSTLGCFAAMGVAHEVVDEARGVLRVHGVGLFGLKQPIDARPLDCGNSGTTMRLLSGLLAAQPFGATLVGDASLTKRPMRRVLEPLRARGAHARGTPHPTKPGEETAPLRFAPLIDDEALGPIEHALPVASAQVKSALLLSGLYAHGTTVVSEPMLSRDHTERMLAAAGVPLRTAGPVVALDPAGWDGVIPPLDLAIPGDVSAASFLVVAGNVIDGSVVRVVEVGTNPTRTGALDVLRAMHGGAEIVPRGESGGEPIGNLEISSASALRGTTIAGELVPRAIDEIPILAVAAAAASGVTEVFDAAELRVKESDRIATMVDVLRAFGVVADERPDGMRIEGAAGRRLTAATVDSRGDHRIAMSAVILGLLADGETRVTDVDCVATSFPGFARTLRDLGADVEAVG